MQLRQAVERDVSAIRLIHQTAIRTVCSKDYPAKVISAWLAGNRDERYLKGIRDTSFWMVQDSDPIGFGNISLISHKIEALFLMPDARGRGIAASLLRHLETIGFQAGLENILVDSSLTAQAFYVKHGYSLREGLGSIWLASGDELLGVPMFKRMRA